MPPALRHAVGGAFFLAEGGYEYDGRSEIAPLNERQLRSIARRIVAAGIRCVAVSGVFSPVQAAQEQRAAAVLLDEAAEAAAAAAEAAAGEGAGGQGGSGSAPADPVGGEPPLLLCQSHEIGQLGLLERENAAVLNAALLPLAQRVVPACKAALAAAGIAAPLLFCTNDGTLLPAAAAAKVRRGHGCRRDTADAHAGHAPLLSQTHPRLPTCAAAGCHVPKRASQQPARCRPAERLGARGCDRHRRHHHRCRPAGGWAATARAPRFSPCRRPYQLPGGCSSGEVSLCLQSRIFRELAALPLTHFTALQAHKPLLLSS